MKPTHIVALCAVVAVALVLWLMQSDDPGRAGDRTAAGRSASSKTSAGDDAGTAPAPATGADRAAALGFRLKVLMPDGTPAAKAVVELSGRRAATLETDRHGALKADGLFAGLYDLVVRKGRATGAKSFELVATADLGTLRLSDSIAIRGTVRDYEGAPIEGALVEAVGGDARRGFDMTTFVRTLTTPEKIAARAQTDADGAYELRVAAGGSYGVRATARGFAQEAEATRAYKDDVDNLDFHLMPGVRIAGRVIDTQSVPVEGARVIVINAIQAFGSQVPKADTVTAADGTFALAVMPSRQMMMVVRATGYAAYMQSQVNLPANNLTITLERGIAVRLRTVDHSLQGLPAPRVQVAIMYKGGFVTGETDDDGRLALDHLPTKGSLMPGGQQQAIFWGGGYIARMISLIKKEPADGVLDLGDVEMVRGGTVRGKVVDKQTRDPIAEAQVRSWGGVNMQLQFFSSATVTTDAEGKYVLEGVPLKATAVTASHPEYVNELNPALMMGARGGGKAIFPQGTTEITKDLELEAAHAVKGVVSGPDGRPVAGATVHLQGQQAMISIVLGLGPQEATTNAEGRFSLGGLKPGQSVQLVATHRDYGTSITTLGRAGEDVAIELTAPLLIAGVVVDEQDGPVKGVRVTAERGKGRPGRGFETSEVQTGAARPAITDAKGEYRLRNAPTGQLTVTFEHPQYAIAQTTIDVTPGTETKELDKTVLSRGHGIEGVVIDEQQQPVGGVRVQASWQPKEGGAAPVIMNDAKGGRTWGNATTDDQGRFAVYGLREGNFRLQIWSQDVIAKRTVVPTGTKDARVELRAAGRVLGRVTSNGRPIANAGVNASVDGDHLSYARTDSEGHFTLPALPPDRAVQIQVHHDGHKTLTVQNVRTSETRQEFALVAGVQIAGIVVDDRGAAIAGARLFVSVGGRFAKSVNTGADGRFEAGGLQDGEITVQLTESNQGIVPSGPVTVTPGDQNIRFVAARGESIRGIVLGPDGEPTKNVRVEALDDTGKTVGSAWVFQDDGGFELRGLPRGVYTVRATRFSRENPNPPKSEVSGVATGTNDVELRLTQ